jgi:hypothetical protein
MAETTNPMVRRLALSLLSAYRHQVGVMAATRSVDQRIPVQAVDAVTVWVANTLAAPDEALARIVLPQLLVRFEQLIEEEHHGGSAWPR